MSGIYSYDQRRPLGAIQVAAAALRRRSSVSVETAPIVVAETEDDGTGVVFLCPDGVERDYAARAVASAPFGPDGALKVDAPERSRPGGSR